MEIKKILFTTDFSEGTAHAMKYAIGMAKQFGARLIILHVVHNIFAYPGLHIPHESFDIMNTELEDSAKKAMQRLCLTAGDSCKDIDSTVVHGVPYEEILKYAADKKIDLLIIGTHGRKGLDRVLLGSTAERIVRSAQCPVLTIRMPI